MPSMFKHTHKFMPTQESTDIIVFGGMWWSILPVRFRTGVLGPPSEPTLVGVLAVSTIVFLALLSSFFTLLRTLRIMRRLSTVLMARLVSFSLTSMTYGQWFWESHAVRINAEVSSNKIMLRTLYSVGSSGTVPSSVTQGSFIISSKVARSCGSLCNMRLIRF